MIAFMPAGISSAEGRFHPEGISSAKRISLRLCKAQSRHDATLSYMKNSAKG